MTAGPPVAARVLVAGVGNVFLSDDGFGSEVARRLLAAGDLPPEVDVVDIGIRGMHLAYQVLEGYRALLLVDTTRSGGPPGTLSLLEHDLAHARGDAAFDPHGMEPDAVLDLVGALARGLGDRGALERVLVLGATPAELGEGMGLSPEVAAAVDEAVDAVPRVVARLLDGRAFELRSGAAPRETTDRARTDGTTGRPSTDRFTTDGHPTEETTDDEDDPGPERAGRRRVAGEGDPPGHQAVPAAAGHVSGRDA